MTMGSTRAKVASGLFCANGWPSWSSIYINFDIKTKFKVSFTKKPTPPTFFNEKLAETFRNDVNMDFAHTNHSRFLI